MVNDVVNEIKQKLSIVDLISRYVSLKKSGTNYKGLCPFHGENTPSFMVSPELQIYKCFGCGEGGDIFSFYEKVEGLDFSATLEALGEIAGVEVRKQDNTYTQGKAILYEINYISAQFYNYLLLNHPAGEIGLKYVLTKRKLDKETINAFYLGYAPKQWDLLVNYLTKKKFNADDMLEAGVIVRKSSGQGFIDKFRGRIIFPFKGTDGKILGFNGRTIFDEQPKYINTASTKVFNKSAFLYGLDLARVEIKKTGAVMVEGQLDVLTAYKYGVRNVIASSGTALTLQQLGQLGRYTKQLVFCYDSDLAGIKASMRGIELAEREGFDVYVCPIPPKYTDLDQFFNADSVGAKHCLSNPIPFYDFVIATSLNANDKHSYVGKNKILSEVAPFLTMTKNPVILDTSVKTLSEALDVSEESIYGVLKSHSSGLNAVVATQSPSSTSSPIDKGSDYDKNRKFPLEEYMLALIMKAPLGTAQALTHRLAKKDFVSEDLQKIFIELKSYLAGRKRKFDIKNFASKLDVSLAGRIEQIYLNDLGEADEEENTFLHELEKTFKRLKKEQLRKELKEVTVKIRKAEKEQDSEELINLVTKLKDLSARLA
ncbi:MAG: hypothetical protein RLY61_86 [Candidatus Parcubacteria bacterium]|jgi:DNA primase